MCRPFISFSAGLAAGFIAGVLIDNKNRTKIHDLLKQQSDKLKPLEKTIKESIDNGIDKVIKSVQNITKPSK